MIMTERQKKLIKDYGPRFVARARILQDEMSKLAADAYSVMTDEEWEECAKAMVKFENELSKLESVVTDRTEAALNEGEDFIDLYGMARDSVKRYI